MAVNDLWSFGLWMFVYLNDVQKAHLIGPASVSISITSGSGACTRPMTFVFSVSGPGRRLRYAADQPNASKPSTVSAERHQTSSGALSRGNTGNQPPGLSIILHQISLAFIMYDG